MKMVDEEKVLESIGDGSSNIHRTDKFEGDDQGLDFLGIIKPVH